jgi:hypothetical protein
MKDLLIFFGGIFLVAIFIALDFMFDLMPRIVKFFRGNK